MRGRRLVAVCLMCLVTFSPTLNLAEAQGTGRQWSEPIDITQPSDSNPHAYGILLCDPYQNVHLFWADLSQNGAAVFYRNDVDGGWSIPNDVVVMPDPVIVELAGDISPSNDTLHLLWLDKYLQGNLYYGQAPLLSADQPRAWSRPLVLAGEVNNADIGVDPSGVIHTVYGAAEDEGRLPTVYHLTSEDGGTTWSDPVVVFSKVLDSESLIRVKMDIDSRGAIHVGIAVRSAEYGAYSEVGYSRSLDGGRTWSKYMSVEEMGTTFQGVHMIAPYAFGEGEIHLTWHDPRRMHMWSHDGGTTWSSPAEIMPLGAAFGGNNELVQDSSGKIHVLTTVGDGVFSAEWNGAEWGIPQQIDDRDIDLHRQKMILCQGNQLHVVYYDTVGPQTVWYATRQVAAPHIARQPLPTLSTVPTALPTTTGPAAPSAAVTPDIAVPGPERTSTSGVAPVTLGPSPLLLLLISATPVLVLMVVVLVLRSRKGQRHEPNR